MKATVAIPRFLLPQRSSIWRSQGISNSLTSQTIRNASHKSPPKPSPNAKPLVLEKPAKFNPPSHGARLRKDPPRYAGPPLSPQQIKAQRTKKYPNMMPAEGTFMHWFLNNRSIHIYITLGTLFSLAGYTSVTHFKRMSKFGDMLPPASDLFFHPINFVRTCLEVLRLHTAAVSAETAERRQRKVDDVQKRAEYRKKHGLETEGFGGWTAKGDGQDLGPAIPASSVQDASPVSPVLAGTEGGEVAAAEVREVVEHVQPQRKPVKKWLGIW